MTFFAAGVNRVRGRSLAKPGLTDLLGVFLVVAVAVIGARRLFGDSDPAMHVATGRWILTHGQVPRADPFSATHGGLPWFAHEWLADLLWASVHGWAGWPGLLALAALLISMAHVLLYRALVRRGDHPMAAFVAVTAAAAAAGSHWLARPHLLSSLFLVVWAVAAERVAAGGRSRATAGLFPVLMLAWANLHGAFLIGLPVLAAYLVGTLLSEAGPDGSARGWGGAIRRSGARSRALGLALAGSAAATLATPYGWRLPAHLISYFALPRTALAGNAEFAPASAADRAGMALMGFLVLCTAALLAGAWASRGRGEDQGPLPAGTLLSFAGTSILALLSIRHAGIAAIFGAMVFSHGASRWLDARADAAARRDWALLRGWEARSGGALWAVSLVAIFGLAAAGWPAWAGYDPARFPVAMVDSLRRSGFVPEGPLFSRDLWGGYLVLELPEARVFVDGRSDMYGDRFMARYVRIYGAGEGWRSELDAAGVRWALLPPEAPLARALEGDRGWSLRRSDGPARLYRRVDPDQGGQGSVDRGLGAPPVPDPGLDSAPAPVTAVTR